MKYLCYSFVFINFKNLHRTKHNRTRKISQTKGECTAYKGRQTMKIPLELLYMLMWIQPFLIWLIVTGNRRLTPCRQNSTFGSVRTLEYFFSGHKQNTETEKIHKFRGVRVWSE